MEKVLGVSLRSLAPRFLSCPRLSSSSSLQALPPPHPLLLLHSSTACPNPPLITCHAQPNHLDGFAHTPYHLPLSHPVIPPLPCSFPLTCHAHVRSIRETCDSWSLSQLNFSPQSQDGKLFLACQYPLLGCLFFANGIDTKRVAASAKYLTCFCFFDSALDVPDQAIQAAGSSRAEVIRAAASLFHAKTASDLPTTVTGGVASATMHSLWSWWTEVREDLSPTQQSRWFQLMKDMVAAAEDHSPFRKSSTVPEVETFVRNRGKAVGVMPLFLLMEYTLRIELDEETLSHRLMSQLHDAVVGHAAWVNDLWSFEAEASKGDYFNILAVMLLNDEFSNLEDAVSKVCDLIKQCDSA